MPKFEFSGARVAAAAGLGLTLALGAAPVVAMADDAPSAQPAADATVDAQAEGVAEVNGEICASLDDVIAKVQANNGGTIRLLQNVELSSTFTVTNGMKVTLDLNGCTVTEQGATDRRIVNNGDLTIIDSSSDGKGTIKNEDENSYGLISNNGSLTIMSGTFLDVARGSGSSIRNNAGAEKLVISGGTFIGTADDSDITPPDYSTSANARIYSEAPLEITGGTFSSLHACYTPLIKIAGSEATIEGVSASTYKAGAVEAAGGVVTITDCSFTVSEANSYYANAVAVSNGGKVTINGGTYTGYEYGAYVYNSGGHIEINGGTFTAKTALKADTSNYEDQPSRIVVSGGEFNGDLGIASGAKLSVAGGKFSSDAVEGYLVPGVSYDESTDRVTTNENNVASVTDKDGLLVGMYSSLANAVAAAPDGGTVTVEKSVSVDSTISANKDVTITSAEGVEIASLSDGRNSFVLSDGAMLDGLHITVSDVSAQTNIVQMNDGTTVRNCTFTGSYDVASNNDAQVVRGIEGSSGTLTIEGNTFTNVRQPGYINACSGTIANNHVTGTRGWVVCGNSNMEFTGNTFSNNAVDIAIIDDSDTDSTNTNNYAKKAADISAANGGAYVENQLGKVEAKNGDIVVGGSTKDGFTLEAALAEAESGDTIRLEADINVTGQVKVGIENVTINGDGHTITYTGTGVTEGNYPFNGGLIDVTANDVKLTNVTIDTKGNTKYGVQFWQSMGGQISDSTIKGGGYASVNVNGSGVTIADTTLEPSDGAYAHIDLSMGSNVAQKPALTVDDITFAGKGDDQAQVWVDDEAVGKIAGEETGESQILDAVNDCITNVGASDVTATVEVSEGKTANTVVDGKRPVTPPTQSGERVNVEQSEGGRVSVSPGRAEKGETVTITVTPDEGKVVRDVLVTDEDGNAVEVTPGEKDGTWTFEMPDGEVSVTATFECDGGELCPSRHLTDVEVGSWYHGAVDWAIETGLMGGMGDGTFAPSEKLSRAQLAVMLWNRADHPEADASAADRFVDADPDGFYAAALDWCVETGAFVGLDDTHFGPSDDMTRESLAVVLWRMADEPESEFDLSDYPDADSVSAFAGTAMRWAVENGVLSGQGDGTLDPQGAVDRSQAAAIFQRLADAE